MGERILIVSNAASSLVGVRLPFIKHLRSTGHEVRCVAPGLGAGSTAAAVLRQEGVSCSPVTLDRAGLDPLADLRLLTELVRHCRTYRPTILFAYTLKPTVYGMWAGWLTRVPRRVAMMTGLGYAFTGQAAGRRGKVQAIVRRLLRSALARATHVIFHNADDRATLRQLQLLAPDASTTVVGGSGVDLDAFPPRSLPAGTTVFLLVARLLVSKGVREFADAAAILKRRGIDARFVLVGPHDENPDAIDPHELEQWIAENRVEWAGAVEDVAASLAASHVFVLPSYREGTPRSTLEALATGRAVVTTDAPGCRETVQHGENGFLVPVGNAECLADAMQRFVDDPALVAGMGHRSLELARHRYDVRIVNRAMMKALGLGGQLQ